MYERELRFYLIAVLETVLQNHFSECVFWKQKRPSFWYFPEKWILRIEKHVFNAFSLFSKKKSFESYQLGTLLKNYSAKLTLKIITKQFLQKF